MNRLASSRSGRLRFRFLLAIVGLLVALVVLGPWLASFDPLRKMVLKAAIPGIQGSISAGDAHFGWFRPLGIDDLQIRDPEGEPVITVGHFGTDRTLWELLVNRRRLGNISIDSPQVHIVATPTSNNLALTFPEIHKQLQGKAPTPHDDSWKSLTVHVAVTNATVTWRVSDAGRSWSIDRIPFSFGIEPAVPGESKPAMIVVDPVVIFDHREVSPGLCNDLLKYVAPVLANVATAEGRVSLALDGGRLPCDDLKQGELEGRLTLHEVEIGAGPLVQVIASVLKVPQTVSLARENVVDFKMTGGRVYHEGLAFGVEQLQVHTHGSVGLDQTLDLTAEVQLHLSDTMTTNRPILRALGDKSLRIPVRGTLNKPEVDTGALAQTGISILLDALGKARRELKPGDSDPGPPAPAPAAVTAADASAPATGPGPATAPSDELTLETLEQLRAAGVLVPRGDAEELPPPPRVADAPTANPNPNPNVTANPNPSPDPTADLVNQIKATGVDLVSDWLRRRQQRKAQEAAQNTPAPAPAGVTAAPQQPPVAAGTPAQPPPPVQQPPPRRGILGRAMDRVRGAIEQDNSAPPPGTAPAPSP